MWKMCKPAILTGLAAAMASLHAGAETATGAIITSLNLEVANIPAYELRRVDRPLTGAARFEAKTDSETFTVHGASYSAPARFQNRIEWSPTSNIANQVHSYGPGPELVAPTPAPVFELRTR
jgi:hypothetical protein